jgi:hypothetical protein
MAQVSRAASWLLLLVELTALAFTGLRVDAR